MSRCGHAERAEGDTPSLLDRVAAPEAQEMPPLAPAFWRQRPRVFAVVTAVIVVGSYLLMVNGRWHFSPDSAVYLSLGRSLMQGEGYVFNGVPHFKYPPGAPLLLAAAMRISTSFAWLNLVNCAVMLAGLAFLYLALRHMVGRPTAALLVLLTGTLFWVHEYAMTLKSEPPFFFLSMLAVLLLMKITQSPPGRRRALLLGALCATWALAFLCRIPAPFWLPPFAATLLLTNRRTFALRHRLTAAAVLCAVGVAALVVYLAWRGGSVEAGLAERAHYRMSFESWRITSRGGVWPPRWILRVLFPFWEQVAAPRAPVLLDHGVNWLFTLIVLLGVWQAARRGQVFLASSVLYLVPFMILGRGNRAALGRYASAAAPFIVALFLYGLGAAGDWLQRKFPRMPGRRGIVALGIVGILLPHSVLLVGDIWVQRSSQYYSHYRAGAYSELFGIWRRLNERGIAEPIGTSGPAARSGTVCMTQCRVVPLPRRFGPHSPDFETTMADFAREHGLRYLITLDDSQPWPFWHLPQHWFGGPAPTAPYWQLWEYGPKEHAVRAVPVEPEYDWPSAVPMDVGGERFRPGKR